MNKLRVGSAGKQRNKYLHFCTRFYVFEVLILIRWRQMIPRWIGHNVPDAMVLFPASALKNKYFKYIKTCAKNIEKKYMWNIEFQPKSVVVPCQKKAFRGVLVSNIYFSFAQEIYKQFTTRIRSKAFETMEKDHILCKKGVIPFLPSESYS